MANAERIAKALALLAAIESKDPKVVAGAVTGAIMEHNPAYAPLAPDLALVLERSLSRSGGVFGRLFGWLWK